MRYLLNLIKNIENDNKEERCSKRRNQVKTQWGNRGCTSEGEFGLGGQSGALANEAGSKRAGTTHGRSRIKGNRRLGMTGMPSKNRKQRPLKLGRKSGV